VSALAKLPCQVCGRELALRRDGLVKPHKYARGLGQEADYCNGTGYRHDRWPVGQRLQHHTGSIWEIAEDRRGQHGDYLIRCVEGSWLEPATGKEMVAHGEYMHRHGWTPITDDCTCGCAFGRHNHRVAGSPCLDCEEPFECSGYDMDVLPSQAAEKRGKS